MPAKRIYRNPRNKVIAGVCAGIADYFDIDVTWVRLGFVLAIFASGVGLLAYIIAWIVIPKDESGAGETAQPSPPADSHSAAKDAKPSAQRSRITGHTRNAVGIILILLGILFFMDRNFYWFDFDLFWPAILVVLGIYMLTRATAGEDEQVASAAPATAGHSDKPHGEGQDHA
jgi:phage shock protein PspC (stress-responsive transcriptional regulator)